MHAIAALGSQGTRAKTQARWEAVDDETQTRYVLRQIRDWQGWAVAWTLTNDETGASQSFESFDAAQNELPGGIVFTRV